MNSFLKWGAGIILTIIIAPLVVWGGTSIIAHGQEIARIQEREKTTTEHYIEIKQDIREIKSYLMDNK